MPFRTALTSSLIALVATAIPAVAQSDWPVKPLRIIVPFAAGSFTEAGFPAYDMSYWWGIAAPGGTPAPIVARLHAEIVRATTKPRLQEVFAKQGARPVTNSSAEQTRRVDQEIRVWRDVIAGAGIKLE